MSAQQARTALILTRAEAQRLQDAARAHGCALMWFVAERAGKAIAWAVVPGPFGGKRLPGDLVADTLDDLREMLPIRADPGRSDGVDAAGGARGLGLTKGTAQRVVL